MAEYIPKTEKCKGCCYSTEHGCLNNYCVKETIIMDKELRNRIAENKILTYNERAKIISDLESYEDLRAGVDKAIEEIEEKVLEDKYDYERFRSTEPDEERARLAKVAYIRGSKILGILKRNIKE